MVLEAGCYTLHKQMIVNDIRWLTVKGAAQWLGVTEQTIRNWIRQGIFLAYQVNPQGRVLIKMEDLVEAIERGEIVSSK